jgi:ABC-2 type transport system ATP-binding protein
MPEPAIEIRNVVKRYDAHVAVRDLSLVIPRGSVYGLLGPNGAGKTTTIRMILDIIEPDSGTISVLGSAHRDRTIQDRVGYLPEERGLYKKMQVRRVLKFLGELKGLSGREADTRITSWLERLGRAHFGEGLGAREGGRALARHAAEGAVHRRATPRS